MAGAAIKTARSKVAIDGRTLGATDVAQVARQHAPVALTRAAAQRNQQAYQSTFELVRRGVPVYGLNTGVGALASVGLEGQGGEEQQKRLLRSHAADAGPSVNPDIGRAMMIVRANQLAAGGAGVHPELLERLVAAIAEGYAPVFGELGSLGTGDLTSLAALGLSLIGERAWQNGELTAAAPLGPRDGLMLMSSNAHAIGEAALCAVDAGTLSLNGERCAALSFEAVRANGSALDARVQDARAHPGQVAAAKHLRERLEGVEAAAARLQDSFAFRCLPQVQGLLRTELERLDQVLRVEINAGAENALLSGDDALPNGNFHAAELAQALNGLRGALAQAASLSARRIADLMSGAVTGQNAFLAERPGVDSGLMALEYTAQSAVGELATLATPVPFSAAVSGNVECHASFASLGARQTTRAVRLHRTVLAAELLAAVRSFQLRGEPPTGTLNRELYQQASEQLGDSLADRPLAPDLIIADSLLAKEGAP